MIVSDFFDAPLKVITLSSICVFHQSMMQSEEKANGKKQARSISGNLKDHTHKKNQTSHTLQKKLHISTGVDSRSPISMSNFHAPIFCLCFGGILQSTALLLPGAKTNMFQGFRGSPEPGRTSCWLLTVCCCFLTDLQDQSQLQVCTQKLLQNGAQGYNLMTVQRPHGRSSICLWRWRKTRCSGGAVSQTGQSSVTKCWLPRRLISNLCLPVCSVSRKHSRSTKFKGRTFY